ncbi:AB hydrolase superfamily protein B1A11.02 [Cladobotryum mycophilum]|uniref:AB hydrolase superfamily protein B1A11.02 n=1 Tax=Cladobotryum mycophilum TaxID=491253 RepID=A0ABR0SVI9_9HYPO
MATEYTTPESLAQLSIVNPELEPLIAARPPSSKEQLSIEEKRAAVSRLLAPFVGNLDKSQVRLIPMRDGHENEIRIYDPQASRPQAETPVVILIHGGAFTVGDNAQLNPYARAISTLYGAVVVSISYRLAPEYKFPYGARDCWDAFTWIAAHSAELGANPAAGFLIGGVSAGANLAAVTCQKAVSENFSPRLTGVWISEAFLLDEATVPEPFKDAFLSRQQNKDAPFLNQDSIRATEKQVGYDVHSPELSPFNIPGAHVGMPPTVVQANGLDPLRDDSLIYERVLREHGVSTRLFVYPGAPHGFWAAFWKTKIAQKWEVDLVENVGWLLGKSADVTSISDALDAGHAS